MGQWTETAYKTESLRKSALHGKTQDSGDTVNATVDVKAVPCIAICRVIVLKSAEDVLGEGHLD